MIIPIEIEIQIVDGTGGPSRLENVLFGLKIFNIDGSWHNYSFLKTDANGAISLARQQIIDNTELRHADHIVSDTPTSFELYVWDGQMISDLIRTMKQLLDIYKNEDIIRNDLVSKGITGNSLTAAVETAKKKSVEDKALYEKIRDAVNGQVQFHPDKISDKWLDMSPKKYKFTMM